MEPKLETEIKIQKRPTNPPKKSDDFDAWFNWYKEEIKDRIVNGQTFEQIKKELNISHVEKFINNEK